mgnify:FL=1
MKITQSYGVKFKGGYMAIKRTIVIFNEAVNYLITPIQENYDDIAELESSLRKMNYVEKLVHNTRNNKAIYDFDDKFYKFPSYLRRSAITKAIGIVSSYMSQIENWKANDCKGAMPKLVKGNHLMPCFYKDNMFDHQNDKTYIKVYRNNDWVWQEIRLNHSDLKYIENKAPLDLWSAPVLEKKYGHYELRFTREFQVELSDKEISKQKVCAVDLGVTNDATVSVLNIHGTVLSRKFINCGKEKDSVTSALNRVSSFQKEHGSHDTKRLWNIAKRRNLNLAHLIVHKIVDYAKENNCDVIVFEHLDTKGKKKGSKKQKLSMWKHQDIQNTAERLAHSYGMRIKRVCAWNTSKLAYDGSGVVLRGKKVSEDTPYDVCKFQNGKTYNCDLSASYNIGARYFIKELIKIYPNIMTEVSDIGSGTSRTLSTLWNINSVMLI